MERRGLSPPKENCSVSLFIKRECDRSPHHGPLQSPLADIGSHVLSREPVKVNQCPASIMGCGLPTMRGEKGAGLGVGAQSIIVPEKAFESQFL